MILASKPMTQAGDAKAAAKVCLEIIELDAEKYRIGHTKVISSSYSWLNLS